MRARARTAAEGKLAVSAVMVAQTDVVQIDHGSMAHAFKDQPHKAVVGNRDAAAVFRLPAISLQPRQVFPAAGHPGVHRPRWRLYAP